MKLIANSILKNINSNIFNINENIHKDFGNAIVNFNTPIDKENLELFLFISIDRSDPEMINQKESFYHKKKEILVGRNTLLGR